MEILIGIVMRYWLGKGVGGIVYNLIAKWWKLKPLTLEVKALEILPPDETGEDRFLAQQLAHVHSRILKKWSKNSSVTAKKLENILGNDWLRLSKMKSSNLSPRKTRFCLN
jgi:hypothetical protein